MSLFFRHCKISACCTKCKIPCETIIIPNGTILLFLYLCNIIVFTMYNIDQLYDIIGADKRHEIWNGRIACSKTDSQRTLLTNNMNDSFNGYSFTLILSGSMTLINAEKHLQFIPGEMYVYYPGSAVSITHISPDYKAMCLIVDYTMAHQSMAFRDLIRASMIPISQFGQSKLTFSEAECKRLQKVLELISDYIDQSLTMKNEILEMLYKVFINDLISIQAFDKVRLDISRQTEEIFISFYSLLLEHFSTQHGIAFYAEQLHITPNYLSRIVKRVTGKTVVACIDEMLAIEATWLIKHTALTVTQMADRLNFASAPSFIKFYKRMRGCSPLSTRTSS